VAVAAAQRQYRLTMGQIRQDGQTITPVTLVTSQVTEGTTLHPKNRERFFLDAGA